MDRMRWVEMDLPLPKDVMYVLVPGKYVGRTSFADMLNDGRPNDANNNSDKRLQPAGVGAVPLRGLTGRTVPTLAALAAAVILSPAPSCAVRFVEPPPPDEDGGLRELACHINWANQVEWPEQVDQVDQDDQDDRTDEVELVDLAVQTDEAEETDETDEADEAVLPDQVDQVPAFDPYEIVFLPSPAQEIIIDSNECESQAEPDVIVLRDELLEDATGRCDCLNHNREEGFMIHCAKCLLWQHAACVGFDRTNVPEMYVCDACQRPPRVAAAHGDHVRFDELPSTSHNIRRELEMKNLAAAMMAASVSAAPRFQGIYPNGRINGAVLHSAAHVEATGEHAYHRDHRDHRDQRTRMAMCGDTDAVEFDAGRPPLSKRLRFSRRNKYASGIDYYELAVANEYSPELCARYDRITNQPALVRCIVSEEDEMLRWFSKHQNTTTTLARIDGKRLVSKMDILAYSPIVELRGTYVLATAYKMRNMHVNMNTPPPRSMASLRDLEIPGPYVFFYKLPAYMLAMLDSVSNAVHMNPFGARASSVSDYEICVDTRTYGNESRFVRRSCRPNAALFHLFERGQIRLFIVAISDIIFNREITIPHESHDLLAAQRYGKRNLLVQPTSTLCVCGLNNYCIFAPPLKEEEEDDPITVTTNRTVLKRIHRMHKREMVSPRANLIFEQGHPTDPGGSNLRYAEKNRARQKSKSRRTKKIKFPSEPLKEPPKSNLSREERKIEAVMRVFQTIEKREQRRQRRTESQRTQSAAKRQASNAMRRAKAKRRPYSGKKRRKCAKKKFFKSVTIGHAGKKIGRSHSIRMQKRAKPRTPLSAAGQIIAVAACQSTSCAGSARSTGVDPTEDNTTTSGAGPMDWIPE